MVSQNERETFSFGVRLGARLLPGDVVLLKGPLGVGKTVVAKGIAEALGIDAPLVSPTYTIVLSYTEGRTPLHHMDLYRLGGYEEFLLTGAQERLEEQAISLIEWGERIESDLSTPFLSVEMSFLPEGKRNLSLKESDPS